ncbi:MAG TPA: hypothetical protein PLO23_09445, partial [Alphaproteobacteria bacterium]|nr:hypothetical protein [Alphaproteobacteria bacterium]
MALVKLEEDEARLKAALEETANQLAQTAKDKDHEAQSQTEASAALEKILEEQKFLQAQEGTDAERLKKLEAEKQKLEEKVTVLEGDYTALMQAAAESKAMSAALSGQIERAESRLKTLTDQKAQAETQKAEALAASSIKAQEQEALKQTESLKAAIEKLQAQKAKLAEKLDGMDESIKSARAAHEEAQNKRASFEA